MKRLIACLLYFSLVTVANANPISTAWSFVIGQETINPEVLKLAKQAYSCAIASGEVRPAQTLTIVDYSRSLYQRRMWVIDMARNKTLFNSLVAHGIGSGSANATSFSNIPNSASSSLGLYLTGNAYRGQFGYSMRLIGLDTGFNDQAESRALVVHGGRNGAPGGIGLTWGCLAVPQKLARPIIDHIKGGNLVFVYYPDPQWLRYSKYLHCSTNRTA